jgi:hypothetical protein
MKDEDIKFCDEQITKKKEHIDKLGAELYDLMRQHDDYLSLEKYYKEERKALIPAIHEKSDEIHKEQCELGQMKRHRSELKRQKKFLEYQHKMVDNQKEKKC